MPGSLRDQFVLCHGVEDLEKHIARDNIPAEYGGDSPFPLGESVEERSLRAFVDERLRQGQEGEEMARQDQQTDGVEPRPAPASSE